MVKKQQLISVVGLLLPNLYPFHMDMLTRVESRFNPGGCVHMNRITRVQPSLQNRVQPCYGVGLNSVIAQHKRVAVVLLHKT